VKPHKRREAAVCIGAGGGGIAVVSIISEFVDVCQ